MRTRTKLDHHFGCFEDALRTPGVVYQFAAVGDGEGSGARESSSAPVPTEREELPYKVELWDETMLSVELVLAVTASGSIGYAAYYAATREYPHRYITLRHKNSVLSRWNGETH